ncbi:MAG: hypothetical protein MRERC_3c035 [Mycoplasmataceae bacterium RC_NB112A]|nr:MAG: hypothetical protein MRERC_3c035 [Mycoplasmataceae bacterium RC_NB112A]
MLFQKVVNISLNSLYLLNKLGNEVNESIDYYSTAEHGIDISFRKMIDTCCHELAHYIQYAKHEKSSINV